MSPRRRPGPWFGATLFFLVVAAIGTLIFFIGRSFVSWFTSAEGPIAQAVIAAAATVMAAAVGVFVTRVSESRREVRKELRALYRDSYELFTRMLFSIMRDVKAAPGEDVSAENMELMVEFGRSVMLNGSDRVVKAWSEWRTTDWSSMPSDTRTVQMAQSLIALMMMMREDFGHKNKKLTEVEVGGIFLNADAIEKIVEPNA